jgi:hypothetical protein
MVLQDDKLAGTLDELVYDYGSVTQHDTNTRSSLTTCVRSLHPFAFTMLT